MKSILILKCNVTCHVGTTAQSACTTPASWWHGLT